MNSEEKIEQLLQQLTLKEKCALLSGKDNWRTVSVPRLGIASIVMTDGPHGVRATEDGGRTYSQATSFPTGVSLAATWNPDLIEHVGEVLADETHALGCDILLGPCVNIVRQPTAGRNFEAYSEDPYLSGRIGTAWVRGLQRRGVGASLKHFACNNQEDDRMRGSSEVDERTMREIYLSQFEMIVKEAQPWTVMCSYNRINGVYASQNTKLLKKILKEEWGYDGAVISDWGANHSIFESVQGGLDLEMPGPAKYYGRLLYEAVQNWQIDIADIDSAVRRILRLLVRAGGFEEKIRPVGALNTKDHQALALKVAKESLTLLKNSFEILPLDPAELKTIAVIGPMANQGVIGGGGSSFLQPPYRTNVLTSLQERLGPQVKIFYAQGCDNFEELPILGPQFVRPPKGRAHGLRGEYFANAEFSGKPILERVDKNLAFWRLSFAPLEITPCPFSVRWSGKLEVPVSGRYTFKSQNSGFLRLFVDGQLIFENGNLSEEIGNPEGAYAELELNKGKAYEIKIEYVRPSYLDHPNLYFRFAFTPPPASDRRLAQAIAAAQKATSALVFVGWPEGHESEGYDRSISGITLTGRQDELIQAVAAVNPRTVVVLYTGSPVAMPWIDAVPAIVQAYYPGQEGGNAVADLLLGKFSPSGKLTVTFPQRLEDTPANNNFGPGRTVYYGEGIFVGYRYYDQRKIEPLFPFGHGLSYTNFAYRDLQIQAIPEGPVQVKLEVENTGGCQGSEVVQLYVSDKKASLPRPPKELKGFAKIELQAGESQTVAFLLDQRAFSFYSPDRQAWVMEPGDFEILVGSSSRDIRLRETINR